MTTLANSDKDFVNIDADLLNHREYLVNKQELTVWEENCSYVTFGTP